jgi:phage-related minor tail protein
MPNSSPDASSTASTRSPIDNSSVAAMSAGFRELNNEIETAKAGSLKLGSTLASALDGVISKGKSATSIVDALADAFSKAALKAAFKPLDQMFSSLFSDIFSGGGAGNMQPFASGGVFSGGMPIPFASGGVISSPVSFPLGNGQTGLAGERGPEAIVPLTRGTDGKLGIASNNGGATTHVTFNVTAADAASFARSETQIAAMLARTVSHGQRNL